MTVIGQERVVNILSRQAEKRVLQPMCFVGEEGTGKKHLAKYFVSLVECERAGEGQPGAPCGECGPCGMIEKEAYPDLMVIEKEASGIKIDTIRDAKNFLLMKPALSKRKYVIIHNAQALRQEAANTLLKILEEPPEYAVIILTAENIFQLLPTIVSRCMTVRFQKYTGEQVNEYLAGQIKDPGERKRVAELSEGRIGRIRKYIENGNYDKRQEILGEFASYCAGSGRIIRAVKNIAGKLDPDNYDYMFNQIACLFINVLKARHKVGTAAAGGREAEALTEATAGKSDAELMDIIDSIQRIRQLRELNISFEDMIEEQLIYLGSKS